MKNLVFWIPFCGGGLCDRIMGICSTKVFAKIFNHNYLIFWDHNDLSSSIKIKQDLIYKKNHVMLEFMLTGTDNFIKMYLETKDIVNDFQKKNGLLWANYNVLNHIKKNPYFTQRYDTTFFNEMFMNEVRNVFSDVFVVDEKIINSIDKNYYSNCLGIHIRTHDKNIYSDKLSEFTKKELEYKFRECKKFIRNNSKKYKKIFVCGDTKFIPDIAKEIFQDTDIEVIYNEGNVIHTGYDQEKINDLGLQKVIKDLLCLGYCQDLIISYNTNFSRIGSLLNPNRKFYCLDKEFEEISVTELCEYTSESRFRMI